MKYRFATKPRPHQRAALRFLLRNRGGGLQVPMRWGKTKVAIDFANAMSRLEGVRRVLVVCPISALGVWPAEVEKHTPPGYDIEWRVVNYESMYDRHYPRKGSREWRPVPSKELHDYDADLFIVDESHNLGNPQTVSSKMACELARRARFRLIMTGTAFHRKPFFVFGQAKLYDESVFGSSFSFFKRQIAVFGGYGGYEVIRYQNLDWMMDRLRPWMWIEDYVPPGDPVVNVIPFHLSGKGLETYAEMEKESIVDLGGEHVVSPIVLSRHLRCQQIAGGWLKRADGKYQRVGHDARRVAQDRFREYAEQGIDKVVVGCRFIPEIRDVAKAAIATGFHPIILYGKVGKEARKRRFAEFQSTDRRAMFIAQMGTAKEGVDLSAASVMMFYSLSESFVTHDQFSRRIEKYGDNRTLMYDYLIPVGTRTEVTFQALQQKEDVARLLARDPDEVERITSRLKGELK